MTILDRFLEKLNNPTVDLEEVLGPNYQTVLDFWTFLDSECVINQMSKVNMRYSEPQAYLKLARQRTLREQVLSIYGEEIGRYYLAFNSHTYATYEIILMDQIIANGEEFMFLPMYDGL